MDQAIRSYLAAEPNLRRYAPAFDRVITNRRGVAVLRGHADGVTVGLKLVLPGGDASGPYPPEDMIRREVAFLDDHGAAIGATHLRESGDAGAGPWMLMDWVGGISADRALAHATTCADTARVFARIARAIDALHAIGMVHGDLQPGHIILEDDTARLVDFALTHRPGTFPYRGAMIHFLAPELAEPMRRGTVLDLDPVAEVYSLGAVLYYAATGKTPTDYGDCTSFDDRLDVIGRSGCNREDDLTETLGIELATTILRCLSKDRGQRFETMSAAALAFEQLAG